VELVRRLPIIFVLSTRTEPLDYVVKPFEPEELVARVRRSVERLSPLEANRGHHRRAPAPA